MKQLLLVLLASPLYIIAQPPNVDQALKKNIKTHIEFLAHDKLEGRRTGSKGERIAAAYISNAFKDAGLKASVTSPGYLQPFEVNDGRQIMPKTEFTINGKALSLHTDYYPFSYSGSGNVSIVSNHRLLADTLDAANLIALNKNNPHFDLLAAINERASSAKKNGKTALLITQNETDGKLNFDAKDKTPQAELPIIILNLKPSFHAISGGEVKDASASIFIEEKKRIGYNVVGYLDNKASNTVVLGAHYDHLGYGEDKNSLYAGDSLMIHNGADDNASGTAALLELAKRLKNSSLKNNNYMFIAFSGEELGLYGSKYFAEHLPTTMSVNYMINMDMLGRLNDSTRGLTIGGFGTSPFWNEVIKTKDPYFKIKLDSSGSGPSDHTSFYRKNIPVLFFFTGTHKDYHKPTDDADKINYEGEAMIIEYIYNIITQSDKQPKLAFTKTREAAAMGKSSFRVTMGIMPDYTFNGNGVLVDGVTEGRPAQKAGILQGDVITQLGDHKFSDVQAYMNALNKFNKGDSTQVKLIRGKEELILKLIF